VGGWVGGDNMFLSISCVHFHICLPFLLVRLDEAKNSFIGSHLKWCNSLMVLQPLIVAQQPLIVVQKGEPAS
jgi:hypothetical protein